MPVKFHGGRRDLDSGKGGKKGKRETLKKAEKFKNGKKGIQYKYTYMHEI